MSSAIQKTVLLLLTFCFLLPPIVKADGLDTAEITLSSPVYTYDGQTHTPTLTVNCGGELLREGLDYTVSYANNRNAGTASVTITGIGSHSGSQVVCFEIEPRTIPMEDIQMISCIKEYDGKKIAYPVFNVSVLPGDDVSIAYGKALFDTPYAGTGKSVKVTGMYLTGEDAENYALESSIITFSNGEITAGTQSSTGAETIQTGESIDLRSLIIGADSIVFDADCDLLGGTLSGSVFTAGSKPGTFVFTASNGETVTITVVQHDASEEPAETTGQEEALTELVTKQETVPLTLTGTSSMVYGSSQTLQTSGETGSVSFTVETIGSRGNATVSAAGVMTATEAGEVLVTATDGTAISQPLFVSIQPATVQIQVKDKTAKVGDSLPSLTVSDYIVSGLVGGDQLKTLPTLSYVAEPDMSKEGKVGIRASGALVPENGNYNSAIVYQDGTLTIHSNPQYAITLVQSIHGTLTVDKTTATEGETITLTALPDASCTLKSLTITEDNGKTHSVTGGQFSMPGANVTVTVLFAEQEAATTGLSFCDVSESDWFHDSVCYVYQNNLMNGTSETTFSPYGTTTRGMVVTILYRMEGSPTAPQRQPFSDVSAGAYYADPVAWCAWNGIVNGMSSTTFSPDSPITREQLAAIFYRYVNWKGLSTRGSGNLAQFSDESMVQDYAREAVGWAVGKGILSGKGNGILDPGGQATRAEAAAILQRVKTLFGL